MCSGVAERWSTWRLDSKRTRVFFWSNVTVILPCPATVPTIFNATGNLFYFNRQSTSTPAYFLRQGCDYTCGASVTALHNWQNNLYWRINGTFDSETKAFHTQPKPGNSQLCTVGTSTWTFYSFGGWQALGEDLSSSTTINPGFNAPAYPNDDYSLPNGSPNSFFVVFDEIQSDAERNRAQSVQKRVEGRQKHPAADEISRSMMHVQQPQQE